MPFANTNGSFTEETLTMSCLFVRAAQNEIFARPLCPFSLKGLPAPPKLSFPAP